MKLLIFGAIGLVVGLGGGVGYTVFFGGGGDASAGSGEVVADSLAQSDSSLVAGGEPDDAAEEPADSEAPEDAAVAAGDSTDAAEEDPQVASADSTGRSIASALIRRPESDSTETDAGQADSTTVEDPTAAQDSAGNESSDAFPTPPSPQPQQAAQGGEDQAQLDEAGYRRVSRILAAMDADEAVLVLNGLPDADVRELLNLLPVRTAASIFAQLDPGRAARLSRAMFDTRGGS